MSIVIRDIVEETINKMLKRQGQPPLESIASEANSLGLVASKQIPPPCAHQVRGRASELGAKRIPVLPPRHVRTLRAAGVEDIVHTGTAVPARAHRSCSRRRSSGNCRTESGARGHADHHGPPRGSGGGWRPVSRIQEACAKK